MPHPKHQSLSLNHLDREHLQSLDQCHPFPMSYNFVHKNQSKAHPYLVDNNSQILGNEVGAYGDLHQLFQEYLLLKNIDAPSTLQDDGLPSLRQLH